MKNPKWLLKSLTSLGLLLAWMCLPAQNIIDPPDGVTKCLMGNASFTVVANPTGAGSPTLSFKWFYKATPSSSANQIFAGGTVTISNNATSSTLAIGVITLSHKGFYYAEVKQSNQPSPVLSAEAELYVGAPLAGAGADMTLTCVVEQVTLNGSGSTQAPGTTYDWKLNGTSVGTTLNVLVSTPGTYILTVTNVCGTAADEVVVIPDMTAPTGLSISPAQPTLTCAQPTVNLMGSASGGAISGVWNGPGLDNHMGLSAAVNMPGVFTFTATLNTTGCSSSVQVTVGQTQNDFPSADVEDPEILTCDNSSLTLIAQNAQNFTSFNWYNGTQIIGGLTAIVSQPGVYVFKMSNNNCKKEYEKTVEQDITPPVLTLDPPQPALCEGFTLELTASGADAYVWSPGGSTDNSIEISDPGTYSVTATNNQNGCTASQSLVISQRPTPQLSIGDTLIVVVKNGNPSTINLSASPAPSEAAWEVVQPTLNVNDLSLDEGTGNISEVYSLKETRAAGRVVYSVKANNQGCMGDEAVVIVRVLPDNGEDLFIPEVITPNGDGQNDYWNILPADGVELTKVTLFNRSGGEIGVIDLATWDASPCPDGTYFYVISYTKGGQGFSEKGAVTILRSTN